MAHARVLALFLVFECCGCWRAYGLVHGPMHRGRSRYALSWASQSTARIRLCIRDLDNEEAYQSLVERTREGNSTAVVEFVSARCAVCKKMKPAMERISSDWPSIEFFSILFEACDKPFFKACGIKSVPHVHILHGGDVLESYASPPAKLKLIEEKLKANGFGHLQRRGFFRRRWREFRDWWD